jgi:hypothetical protein
MKKQNQRFIHSTRLSFPHYPSISKPSYIFGNYDVELRIYFHKTRQIDCKYTFLTVLEVLKFIEY